MVNKPKNKASAKPVRVVLKGSIPSPNKVQGYQVKQLVNTPDGSDWLRKYLNPNGELAAYSTSGRVPDGTTKRSGCFNIHKYLTLSRPVVAASEDSPNWSVWSISTNLMWTSHIFVGDLQGRDALSASDLDACITMINEWTDQPFNEWVKVNDNVYIMLHVDSSFQDFATYTKGVLPKADFVKCRQTYKGDTFRFVGSNLQNQGQALAAKYPVNVDSIPLSVLPDPPAAVDSVDGFYSTTDAEDDKGRRATRDQYPKTVERITLIDVPPLNMAYLTEADPSAYSGRASAGVYSINYNTQDDFAWHTMGEHRFVSLSRTFAPLHSVRELTGNLTDIVSPQWETGVVAFVSVGPTASIQLESRRGIEFLANVGSKYANLQSDAPKFDPMPVRLAKSIAMSLKSGYPAAYNDWGKLWNNIKDILPTVVGWIPGIGNALKPAVRPVVDALEGLIVGRQPASNNVSGNPTNNAGGGRGRR